MEWSPRTLTGLPDPIGSHHLATDSDGAVHVVTGGMYYRFGPKGDLERSDDLIPPAPFAIVAASITVTENDDIYIAAHSAGVLYILKSTDGGNTFSVVHTAVVPFLAAQDIISTDTDRVYVLYQTTVHTLRIITTSDGFTTSTEYTVATIGNLWTQGAYLSILPGTSASTDILFASTTQTLGAPSVSMLTVYRSMDGGVNWASSFANPEPAPVENFSTRVIVVETTLYFFYSNNPLAAGTWEMKFTKSTDSGATWSAAQVLSFNSTDHILSRAAPFYSCPLLYFPGYENATLQRTFMATGEPDDLTFLPIYVSGTSPAEIVSTTTEPIDIAFFDGWLYFLVHDIITGDVILLSSHISLSGVRDIFLQLFEQYGSQQVFIDTVESKARMKLLDSRAAYPDAYPGYSGDAILTRPVCYGPTISTGSKIVFDGQEYVAKSRFRIVAFGQYWVEKWLLYIDQTAPPAPGGLR